MNVFENVRLGITDEDKYRDLDYARERVAECIKLVNLPPETVEKYPGRALGRHAEAGRASRGRSPGSPKYLLYDEPTSGLDPVNADIIDELVQRLDESSASPSVMVTHDVRGAFRVGQPARAADRGQDRPCRARRRSSWRRRTRKVQEFLERDFDNATIAA